MNLGWKLAATIHGHAPASLLDSYERERLPVAAQVLDWSRAQVALMRPSHSSRALEAVIRDLIATRDGATYFAERVWGVGLRYDLGDDHPLTGSARITASMVVAGLLLLPVLVALRQAEPNIQVELVALDVAQNLLRRDADIALQIFDPTQNAPIARRLGDTPLGLFGARAFLARHGSRSARWPASQRKAREAARKAV